MGKFRNVFFGGYQKAEVDEYVESLLSALERAKSGEGKEGAQKEKELEEAKANLQREQEEKNQENPCLYAQISSVRTSAAPKLFAFSSIRVLIRLRTV